MLKFFMLLFHTFQFFIEKIFKEKFHEIDLFLPLISRVFLAWFLWYFNLHKWQKQTRHTYIILHVVVPYMMMSEIKSFKVSSLVWVYLVYSMYVCMIVQKNFLAQKSKLHIVSGIRIIEKPPWSSAR